MMKRLVCVCLVFLFLGLPSLAATGLSEIFPELDSWDTADETLPVWAEETLETAALTPGTIDVPSALLMEKETGRILFAQAEHEKRFPASVTKVMTMLLTMEALDKGVLRVDERVTISRHAQDMGGSQVFLAEGEQYTVNDLLKAVVIASGNDASVALAEHLAGTEDAFVNLMNERARQLGMNDTNFANCTGLPAPGHVTSAHDIALMSRELLLNHPGIRDYTTVWMDTLRDGSFTLANTNKLIRFYQGATGLKTGSTSEALFCLSGSAERDGMELISVVLGAKSSDIRFQTARQLLDFGFANYVLTPVFPDAALLPVPVLLGRQSEVQPVLQNEDHILVEKMKAGDIRKNITMVSDVNAPVAKGQKLGEIVLQTGDEVLATIPLVSSADIPRLTYWQIVGRLFRHLFMA